MFSAIQLCESKRNLDIPSKWIKHFSSARMCNQGLKSQIHRKFIVYYSPDRSAVPNFRQPFSHDFGDHKNGVYIAKIHNFYGKLENFNTGLNTELNIF